MSTNNYLITPSLYYAFHYYTQTDFEIYGEKAAEIEKKALNDFIDTLNKVRKPITEIQQRGIDFENAVYDLTCGKEVKHENAADVAKIVAGGIWQQKLCKTIGNYVLYGKSDVIKGNTIYDIKRVTAYECPKYEQSIQHLLYLECTPLEHFKYIVSDGENIYEEYYHKDADNQEKLIGRIENMVRFIRSNPTFNTAFESNWHSKY